MRHLLSTADLSRADALAVLDTAEEMAAVNQREVKKLPALRGRTVVNLFLEDSTRTRISFEAAAKRLSADVINFSAKGSSVSKGESLKDTVQTLEAIGADAIVMRHWSSGAARQLADSGWVRSAVVNAGDGTHEHPTQALLDAFTLRRRLAAATGEDLVVLRGESAAAGLISRPRFIGPGCMTTGSSSRAPRPAVRRAKRSSVSPQVRVYSPADGKKAPPIRSAWTRSIMTASGPASRASSSE